MCKAKKEKRATLPFCLLQRSVHLSKLIQALIKAGHMAHLSKSDSSSTPTSFLDFIILYCERLNRDSKGGGEKKWFQVPNKKQHPKDMG